MYRVFLLQLVSLKAGVVTGIELVGDHDTGSDQDQLKLVPMDFFSNKNQGIYLIAYQKLTKVETYLTEKRGRKSLKLQT